MPIEDTVGAIAEMVKAGHVRHVGLSESRRRHHAPRPRRHSDLRPADRVLAPLPRDREGDPADGPRARHRVTAYGVLSRGLLSGHWSKERAVAPGDIRGRAPRFAGENLEHNLALVEALRAVAAAKGATVAQVAIAWVRSRGPDVVPLVGARRRDRLAEALGALGARPDRGGPRGIERAVPPGAAAGDRYDAHSMDQLDSERET